MATSTTSQSTAHPPLFAYRNTITGSNTIRPRTLGETATNSLLITTERIKSNVSSPARPVRPPLPTATVTAMTTAPNSFQQAQRYANHSTKSRNQQDKLTASKGIKMLLNKSKHTTDFIINFK